MKLLNVVFGVVMACAVVVTAGCSSPSESASFGSKTGFLRTDVRDRDDDGIVSQEEWLVAGGMEGGIRPKGGSAQVAASEEALRPAPKRAPISDLMVKVADLSGEEPMTPVYFKSPPGARVVRVEF